MLNIPEAVKELFMADGIRKNFRITFDDKRRADITNDNIISESVKFTESVCSEQKLKFGRFERSILELDVVGIENIKGARIRAFYEIDATTLPASMQTIKSDVDFPIYQIPLGEFVVDKCPRTKADMERRKVTAYTPDMIELVTGLGFENFKAQEYLDVEYQTVNTQNVYECYFNRSETPPTSEYEPATVTVETFQNAHEINFWGSANGKPKFFPNKENWEYYEYYDVSIGAIDGAWCKFANETGIFRISYEFDEQKDAFFDQFIEEMKASEYRLETTDFSEFNLLRRPAGQMAARGTSAMGEQLNLSYPVESAKKFAQYAFGPLERARWTTRVKITIAKTTIQNPNGYEREIISEIIVPTGVVNPQITAYRLKSNTQVKNVIKASEFDIPGVPGKYKSIYANYNVEDYSIAYGEMLGKLHRIKRGEITGWGMSEIMPLFYGGSEEGQEINFTYYPGRYENIWVGEYIDGKYRKGVYIQFPLNEYYAEYEMLIDEYYEDNIFLPDSQQWLDDGEIYDLTENVVMQKLGYIQNNEINYFEVEQVIAFIKTLRSQCRKLSYTPIELTAKGLPFMEAGDQIKVILPDGTEVLSYILSRTLTGIQHLTDEIIAEGE